MLTIVLGWKCGNTIFVTSEALAGLFIVKLGLIDDEDFLNNLGPPKGEIYCKNNWAWEKPFEGAEQKQTM